MTLAAGTRLGPYEILSALGAGGMGEVYKARDTKLNRDVAIKVLPAASSSDAERRERFEREAQAIAALNHPNIVTIHSVEQIDDHLLLTMELVVGRSLADVLPKDGFPLDRLLKIALPVLDAVVAAHQKGITHRDLKPANIMLGDGEMEGRVKVLDFGLAKLAEAPAAAAGATMMPTAPITGEGRILGTVAYMSPEQAEGKTVDARTDLFSLGVILYEMATGQRPFTGDTSISIISSILKDTPKSITDINPTLPRDLARIVRRALTKDPERRYQTAKDLRSDLEELKASLDSGELLASSSTIGTAQTLPAAAPRRRGMAAAGIATAAVLAIAGGAFVVMHRGGAPNGTAPAASSSASLQDLQVMQLTTSGDADWPAVSPDGKFVAYVQHDSGNILSSLWVRQSATNSNVQVVPSDPNIPVTAITVTPDGNFIDFVRGAPGVGVVPSLWRVSFLGGTPKRLIDDVWSAVGWSPDGKSLAFVRTNLRETPTTDSLIVADADGRQERVVARRKRPSRFASLSVNIGPVARPAWSLDGRLIALTGEQGSSDGTPATPQVIVIETATGTEHAIMMPAVYQTSVVAWLDADSLVVNAADPASPMQLWRLSYPGGQRSRLTNDLNNYWGISLTADRASLATARSETRRGVWVADGSGGNVDEVVPSNSSIGPAVGWAGDRLLYVTRSPGASSIAIGGPGASRGETIVTKGVGPTATSNGQTIVFFSTDPTTPGLWKVDVDSRQPVQLVSGTPSPIVVTPDDRAVIFLTNRTGVQSPWIVPLDGGTPSQIANVFAASRGISVSPDSRWLLFTTNQDAVSDVVMCALPSCSDLKRIPIPRHVGGVRWSPDGQGVAYHDTTPQANIWIQPLDGKAPRQITHLTDGQRIVNFAWTRDGKRLALNREVTSNDIVLFKGLRQN